MLEGCARGGVWLGPARGAVKFHSMLNWGESWCKGDCGSNGIFRWLGNQTRKP